MFTHVRAKESDFRIIKLNPVVKTYYSELRYAVWRTKGGMLEMTKEREPELMGGFYSKEEAKEYIDELCQPLFIPERDD